MPPSETRQRLHRCACCERLLWGQVLSTRFRDRCLDCHNAGCQWPTLSGPDTCSFLYAQRLAAAFPDPNPASPEELAEVYRSLGAEPAWCEPGLPHNPRGCDCHEGG